MHVSEDEHEGERTEERQRPGQRLGQPEAPPPESRPGNNGGGASCGSTSSESSPGPKPGDEPNQNSRSMAALPKTAREYPSEAPSSSSTHMGPSMHMPSPPASFPLPAMTDNSVPAPTPPRPSTLLPLLRCALCRLLLEAPTTLNCGHTVCSKHMDPAHEDPSREPSFGKCPVEACRPRQPARVRVLGHPNELDRGVTFTPAQSSAPSESSLSTSSLGRVVRLDVSISKLLELITTAARQANPPPPRDESPATDDDDSPIGARNLAVQGRFSALDRTDPSRPVSPSSSASSPPPRKKIRTHPPAHTPTGLPDPTSFEKELLNELTCEICFMLLCNPITTPCQHTFCSTCLERSLDHSTKCPLCRLDLPPNAYFYQHAPNEVIVRIIAKAFPKLLQERISIAETDGRDSRLDTPIFVCQLSYPGMPTLLHFFEPRYRLMLRRCLLSATPRFGMVMPRQNANNTDGNDFGTMLEIKNVQMLSDGRSMVETYGTFRFRILERGTLDGYLVGRIERIDDYPPEVEAEIERIAMMNPSEGDLTMRGIERSNQELVDVCRRFLDQLRNGTAPWVVQRLNNTYGPMPNDVASFSFWVALVLPIDEQEKAKLLPIRSPRMRLRLVVHWIEQLNNNWWFSSGTWIILQLFRR
ncbi:hypothetical protein FRC11_012354 [Ceratobasidium sp. 423]|nr:hypothetical protein FRC11_012354 [Ceratobasidium sp. 423]